jgi:molybdate transport system ATP-binding protein
MGTASDLLLCLRLKRDRFELALDLSLPGQGISVILGPSGSGKTTLLRCVAGLERAHGRVQLGDQVWQDSDRDHFKPTWQRDLGYVFQEASLFDHLSVTDNLSYGQQRVRKNGSDRALQEAIELLGIGALRDRMPASLSGGERQRVAIARALALQPGLLLLDEPLASLDAARKDEILPWLERLHRQLSIPALYVTHSMDELARLADHAVALQHGKVLASASPQTVLTNPRVALAVGDQAGTVTEGQVVGRDERWHLVEIAFDGGRLWLRAPPQPLAPGQGVRTRILARDVSLSLSARESSTLQNRLAGVIESVHDDVHPSQALVRVRCGGTLILARVTQRALHALGLHTGSAVWCQIKSAALVG